MECGIVIVAGFGFRGSASISSLRDALSKASGTHDITHLATVSDKAKSDVFMAFSKAMGVPIVEVRATEMMTQPTQTQSTASQAARHTGSVAEASALAAAGPGARLLEPRSISTDRLATCALAQGAST
ncbi:MAG: cobalamin biosynthesis protein [Paracoccaceae bacterium]